MIIEYKLRGEVVDLKSDLTKPFRTEDADIYLDKRQGWLDFKVEFNFDVASFKSEIYDIKRTKNSTKLKTNTTAISLTDIVVDGKPYFLKLNKFEPSLEVVSHEGSFYTNTPFYDADEGIYTERVIPKDLQVTYKSKYIEITAPPNTHFKLDEYVISPQIINPFTVYIPSFYLETYNGKLHRCIDSNIRYFTSSANTTSGNYLRYKLATSTDKASKDFNIYLSDDPNTQLEFRISSHSLPLKNTTHYFKIDGSILPSTKGDYAFKIIKEVDTSKVVITPNNYKSDKTYNNVLGTLVNSLGEEDASINDFGITYRPIERTLPRYNYINYDNTYIMVSNASVDFKGTFKERSLHEDSFKVKGIELDTTDHIRVDGKLYEVLDEH